MSRLRIAVGLLAVLGLAVAVGRFVPPRADAPVEPATVPEPDASEGPPAARHEPAAPDADPGALEKQPAPLRLGGSVTDARTGAPIAGARVLGREAPNEFHAERRDFEVGEVRGEAVSGADGTFTLPDAGALLHVTADGYASVRKVLWNLEEASESGVEVRLVRAGAIEGRGTGPGGAPVPGARVCAAPDRYAKPLGDDPRYWWMGDSLPFRPRSGARDLMAAERTRTGADGSYRLATLAPGLLWRLWAEGEGFAAAAPTDAIRVPVGETVRVDHRVRRGARLTVGVPAGARVTLVPTCDVGRRSFRRDDGSGIARFDGVVPGGYDVFVAAEGLESRKVAIRLEEGESRELDVELEPPREPGPEDPKDVVVYEGRILDDRRIPVAGAFRFVKPRKGRPDFVVSKEGYRTVRIGYGKPEDFAEIMLSRMSWIRFPIRLPPGVRVDRSVTLDIRHSGGRYTLQWSWERFVKQGIAEIPLRGNAYRLYLRAPGFTPVELEFEVEPGETLELPEVVLSTGVSVDVLVTSAKGGPVEDARVFAFQNSADIEGRTDAHGRVRLGPLIEGEKAYFRAWAKGHAYPRPTARVVEETGPPVQLVLNPLVRLRGEVVDAAGTSVPFFHVRVTAVPEPPEGMFPRSCETDNTGRFELDLPPGRYLVEAPCFVDGEPAGDSREVELTEGETEVRRLRIRR